MKSQENNHGNPVGKAPVAGEYIMRVLGTSQLLPSRRNVYDPKRHPQLDAEYLPTIRFKGSRRAVLETLRNVPMLNDFEAGYEALGRRWPKPATWRTMNAPTW